MFNHPRKELHPRVSMGIFFIILGIALLIAVNDVLNLGSVGSYFNWKTAMLFIGLLLFLNLEFIGGMLLMAAGVWFMRAQLFPLSLEAFDKFFWPAVIGCIGIGFILGVLFNRKQLN